MTQATKDSPTPLPEEVVKEINMRCGGLDAAPRSLWRPEVERIALLAYKMGQEARAIAEPDFDLALIRAALEAAAKACHDSYKAYEVARKNSQDGAMEERNGIRAYVASNLKAHIRSLSPQSILDEYRRGK